MIDISFEHNKHKTLFLPRFLSLLHTLLCSPVTKIVNGRKKTSLLDSADVFILHLCKNHCQ